MAQIIPFKALRFNTDIVSGDDVVAPPYDVISEEYKERLYQKSPYNIVRIDFGKDEVKDSVSNKYTIAKRYLYEWIDKKILIRDDTPCFYGYDITYKVGSASHTMRGTFVLCKIEELGQGVYPHEHTHSKPKTDRLNLMKSCLANISPIFAIYRGNNQKMRNTNPIFKAIDADGFSHELHKIDDQISIKELISDLKDKPLFIADGHHRYEVALEFKKLADKGLIDGLIEYEGFRPWDYVLMYIVDVNNSDITVLPTHRLVKTIPGGDNVLEKLNSHFDIFSLPYNNNPEEIRLHLQKEGKNSFGLYLGNEEWFLLKYRKNALSSLHPALQDIDTVILQELILKEDLKTEEIYYDMDIRKAVSLIRSGDYKALFVLNPTGIEDVERVAIHNLRMPPKSTYFYPKLLTGMVINTFFNKTNHQKEGRKWL